MNPEKNDALPGEPSGLPQDWLPTGDAPGEGGLPPWLDTELPDFLKAESFPALAEPEEVASPPAEVPIVEPLPAELSSPPVTPPSVAADSPWFRTPPKIRKQRLGYWFQVRRPSVPTVVKVLVQHVLPPSTRLIRAEPQPRLDDNRLLWDLDGLAPGAKQRLAVWVEPTVAGLVLDATCATFQVAYVHATQIARPHFTLTLEGPATVPEDTEASFHLKVTNDGTAPATGVVAHVLLPAGLRFTSDAPATIDFGSLVVGESIEGDLMLTTVDAGRHALEVTVRTEGGVEAMSRATVLVTRPALAVKLSGSASCFLNDTLARHVEVANPGNAPATDVEIRIHLPESADIIDAEDAISIDRESCSICWRLATLGAGQSRSLPLRVKARTPGDYVYHLVARAGRRLQVTSDVPISHELGTSGTVLANLLAELDEELAPRAPERAIPRLQSASDDRTERHLVFTLAGTDYAVEASHIREIGRPLPIRPVPNVPSWLLGVANVRGDIVSMVHLRSFLGLDRSATGDARLMVVQSSSAGMVTGLIVDHVRGIWSLPQEGINPPRFAVQERITPYLRGVTEAHGRLLVLLDLEQLLLSPEMQQFESP
jgi:purine-binding chemotaxis protein CheW